ncbi:transcriptional activator domain-containing protein [Lachnospiraceae bacterium NK3A20]|nr:transcriptional activator domain-containing protein [Lachnospiraceae bacterium NK3A20]
MAKEMKTLHVRMFGEFALNYAGNEIILGRNIVSKFTQLLQLVWLHGDKGISKQELIRNLYDTDELANLNNSFNNLLFQARKQMVRAGLPEENYIVKRGKIYVADPKVPLDIDVMNFNRLCTEAEEETNPIIKNELYTEALELYRGELLQENKTKSWVLTKRGIFRDMFNQAVHFVGDYAKGQKDYDTMFFVYEKAAKIYPANAWQAGQIEALICKEEYEQAYRLYNKTACFYSDETDLSLSAKMADNYRKISQKFNFPMKNLYEIQSVLKEKDLANGGYYCTYLGFIDIYHAFERNMKRIGCSVYLLLCTLVDYEGKPFRNQDKLSRISEELCSAINISLHREDIFTKLNASQYLILFIGSDKDSCKTVSNRISKKLKEQTGNRAKVHWSSISLAAY